MTNEEIKKFAKASLDKGMVNEKMARYAIEKMKRSELKLYLQYLKYEMSKNIITISVPFEPSAQTKREFVSMFGDKPLRFVIDESLGAGIKIKNGDDIIDLSLKNYIITTIREIRETL